MKTKLSITTMSEDLVFKVAFGTLFGIAGLWLFVWCLMWFIDLINELFEEPKVSFLALLLLILIAAIVYYFVK